MNKIKLKLKGDDCSIITQLIQDSAGQQIMHHQITNLVHDLILEVLEKTHGRSLWTDKKNTISLTAPQARAFNLHFAQIDLSDLPYEQNLIRQLVAQINQDLTNRNKQIIGNQLVKY